VKMSAFCSTSNVRFFCCCWACGGLWATRLRCPQIHRLLGRRADSSDLRDDIVGASFRIKAGEAARAVEDGEPAVRVLMHAHGGADIVVAMALRRNLQTAAVPGDAIVGADHAILLDAQHVLERPADIGHEGRARLGRRHREAGVVVGHEAFLEEPVAAATVLIRARRSSCGSRFCSVPNTRSMRPRACGE
jgi:hypothetical protein